MRELMSTLRIALREPLLHFLVIGAGLFFLFSFTNGPAVDKPNRIVVSPGQVEQLADKFYRTWMRPPNEQEIDSLVDDFVRNEVFFREAIALGLDKGDALIRRRMRQKLEFILEDVTALLDPSDEELTAFMHQHEERFRLKPQVSFQQVYLNYNKRSDINADAVKLLARLQAGDKPEQLGDKTMLAGAYQLATQTEIERNFGEAFARRLVALRPGSWFGPVISSFGGHLVLVKERVDGRLPKLADVRKDVLRDWFLEQRKILKERTFRKLLEGYEVVIESSVKLSDTAAATNPLEVGVR